MSVTAVITRQRRARADSSWAFRVASEDVVIEGTVKVAVTVDDITYERAGWRAAEIVEAICVEMTDLPVNITYEGLPPHPAAQKAEPPKVDAVTLVGRKHDAEE